MLKQQNLQVGWKSGEDLQVAGTNGDMTESLPARDTFQDHAFNHYLRTLNLLLRDEIFYWISQRKKKGVFPLTMKILWHRTNTTWIPMFFLQIFKDAVKLS